MENKYHKFVLDHLSEMNPPLFFDHFKFEYAKKSTAEQLLSNSLSYLLRHLNDPVRSLAQEKMKDLKSWKESQYANEYWQGIEIKEAKQKAETAAKISELQIEAILHEDTIQHSNAVSNLTRNKITALSKRPDVGVSEDLKNNPFIEPTVLPTPDTDVSEDLKNNPFTKPAVLPTAPSSHTDSEDLEHNSFKPTDPPTTPTTSGNTTTRQNILKRSNNAIHNDLLNELDIYEMSYEMDWAPWKFDIIINDVNIERVLLDLYEKCQRTRPKIKTSLEYGIIDLNDGIISRALNQSVMSYFEATMQEYKPKKVLSVEVVKMLKSFNVTSLEDLGRALTEVKIDYCNLDRDIVYLRRLFEKFFLLFQNKSTLNLDNTDLPEGWYNSHIVASIFDDCLETMDECILRRGEVESFVQKLLDKKSRKKKKYDGILSFSRQFEFIYVETATTSILSKTDKDLSKLHQAIVLMYKHLVSALPEKLLHELSSMPVLCVQFSGVSVEVYLACWPANIRPVVLSIMDFEIPEEITTFPKLTKVAAKMLSLRPFIQDLHKRYQTLLMKEADYYLDDENTWTSPLKIKTRH